MINKNKLYFFASLMTFCFAKAVTFDVNVNVGAASLSNVKSKINKKAPLLSPEWYFTDAVAHPVTLLRLKTESEATNGNDRFWSKDGGATWTAADVAAAGGDVNTFGSKASYQNYVTSVAKDYALEGDYERHHYEYKDSVRNQKGGFAAGLDVGVRYELTPCVKIGARAFFTATNLKQDVSYSVTPLDKNGNFLRPSAYPNEEPNANFDELYREWKAQIERFIKLAGKKPTHIDSHHHVHLLPQHHYVVIKLAKEYDLPIRQRDQIINNYQYVRCNDQFYKDNVNYEYLTSAINDIDEYGEIMCHPALLDWRLYQMSSYNIPRMKELDLLCDKKIKQFIKDKDIELINYSNLKKTD